MKYHITEEARKKIDLWKNGQLSGMRGKTSTAHWLRNYILEKFDYKCTECGWNKTNSHTGRIPLELEHIDGDFTNNSEENLTILCPNCHSLTKSYKGGNKKSGRPRAKYYRGL